MHYKDGTEAKVGDLVKGTAYNTKNPDGTPRVIVGEMLSISPGSDTCNCTVMFAERSDASLEAVEKAQGNYRVPVVRSTSANGEIKRHVVCVATDYSECKAFELVHRPG